MREKECRTRFKVLHALLSFQGLKEIFDAMKVSAVRDLNKKLREKDHENETTAGQWQGYPRIHVQDAQYGQFDGH